MTVLAPPPRHDEREALIKEARDRQRQRRFAIAVAVALVAAATLGIYAVVGGSHARLSTGGDDGGTVPSCSLSSIALSVVPMSNPTGLGRQALLLGNESGAACRLAAPPSLTFGDARGAIPFVYAHEGTSRPLVIAAGASAVVVFSKFRCDMGDAREATRLAVTVGGASQAVPLTQHGPAICRPGVPVEGRTVMVYPPAPSLQAASSGSLREVP